MTFPQNITEDIIGSSTGKHSEQVISMSVVAKV